MTTALRIKQLTVKGFKGFRDEVTLDLDADVVLLVGKNGRGKTSVVEAIEAIVCGPSRVHGGSGTDDLVHRGEDTAILRASFLAEYGDEQHDVTITRGGTDPGSLIDQRTGTEWHRWRGDRVRQLQALAFLYADNLGLAASGLDLGMLVPETEVVGQLAADARELSASVQGLLSEAKAAEAQRRAAVQSRVAALRVVEERAAALGLTVKLATATTEAKKPDRAALDARLAPDAASPPEWGALAAAAQEVARTIRAGTTSPNTSLQGLRDDVAGIRSATGASVLPLADDGAAARLASLTAELAQGDAEVAALMARRDTILRRPNTSGDEVATGEVPLLRSLIALGPEGVRGVLGDAGMELRGKWDAERMGMLVAARLTARKDAEDTALAAATELSSKRALREELARAQTPAVRDAVARVIAAWPTAVGGEPPIQDGKLDLLAATTLLTDATSSTVRAEALRWEDLARALDGVARLPPPDGPPKAERQQLSERKDALDALWSPRPDGTTALSHHLRHAFALPRFRDPTVRTMRGLLGCYRFGDGFAEQVGIDDDFQVRVGSAGRRSSFRSLSRSQQAAVATTQALALNLALPDPPIGFVCIDDLSDSFDLGNLTAGSLLLRTVAYGPETQRRQILLSSHDELVTERLIPLLLPPAERSMKVVELIDGAPPRVVVIQGDRAGAKGGALRVHYPPKG